MKVIAILTLLVAVASYTAYGLECYTYLNIGAEEWKDFNFTGKAVPCVGESAICQKTKTKLDGNVTYTGGCAMPSMYNGETKGCDDSTMFGKFTKTCLCASESEPCNGSSFVQASGLAMAVAVAMRYLF